MESLRNPPVQKTIDERFPSDLIKLATTFMVFFGMVAIGLAYWGVFRAPNLLARDDNPRLVEDELRIERGAILDRNGLLLAFTTGELGAFERKYLVPASPVLGYYSLRYGVSGIESTYNSVLLGVKGNSWESSLDAIIHRYPVGRDVQLTLDAGLQRAADEALGDRNGAVVLLDAGTGSILAVVSHPGFDPNLLDEAFESLNEDTNAPLLDRAVQSLYQPGSALQPFVLALALDEGLAGVDDPVDALTDPIQVDGVWVSCVQEPIKSTLGGAMDYGCPAPFAAIAGRLTWDDLIRGVEKFGFFDTLELPLVLAKGAQSNSLTNGEGLAAEVLGQGNLTASPLEMAWALSTLANDGERLPLQLVQRVGKNGSWDVVVPSAGDVQSGFSQDIIDQVRAVMVESVNSGAASAAKSANVRIAGHVGVAVTGPQKANHTWFLGFTPTDINQSTGHYVVVVLLEETDDIDQAASVGGRILETAAR